MMLIDSVVHFYRNFYSTFPLFPCFFLTTFFLPHQHQGVILTRILLHLDMHEINPWNTPTVTDVRNINFCQLFLIFYTFIIRTIKSDMFDLGIIAIVVGNNGRYEKGCTMRLFIPHLFQGGLIFGFQHWWVFFLLIAGKQTLHSGCSSLRLIFFSYLD